MMNYFNQLGESFKRAAHSLSDGWQHLWQAASSALTHFSSSSKDAQESKSLQWGVLSCEMTDNDKVIELKLEVPGVEEKDLAIDISGQRLTISGERHYENKTEDRNFILQERAYGRFTRQFMLPDKVEADQAKAKYKNGVLHLSLPKSSENEKQSIPISSS